MLLNDVFEQFARDSPLSVMAQGVLENALNPTVVDQLFEDVAERQYTRKLLFSSVVDLMGLVVCRIQPAVHAAYQAHAETIGASLRAVYSKLDHAEPALSAALVHMTASHHITWRVTSPAIGVVTHTAIRRSRYWNHRMR